MVKAAEAVVRAYDLGGFGDIAGAMRVASFLQRTGIDTNIAASSISAFRKLQILGPDVSYGVKSKMPEGHLQVDVAGHYGDNRNAPNKDVPHHFTEDMDNPQNRRKEVPIYLKSGLVDHADTAPSVYGGATSAPMFYRPFREWDLPKPGERDVRKLIMNAFQEENPNWAQRLLSKPKHSRLEKVLDNIDRIGFAHYSPQILAQPAKALIDHPYLRLLHQANISHDKNFGIGLFVGEKKEEELTRTALQNHWGVIGSDGQIRKYDPDVPTLIFLGPRPQIETSSLFVSAEMPNLVTGDLSLSDAMYATIAMDGPGFFYETPGWKLPTLIELMKMHGTFEQGLDMALLFGSNNNFKINMPPSEISGFHNAIAEMFGDDTLMAKYEMDQRTAIRNEIRRRFGNVRTNAMGPDEDGLYIPKGAPYLLQDATAQVVETLREDPDALSDVEDVRKAIKDGVPVTINVGTGALEPEKPKQPEQSAQEYESLLDKLLDYTEYSKRLLKS